MLLILNEPDVIFNASTCGNNCAPFILKIADLVEKDITINLHHLMDFGSRSFSIKIENADTVVHTMKELVQVSLPFLQAEE